jgi:hypothetical protein
LTTSAPPRRTSRQPSACLIDSEDCGYLLTAVSLQTAHLFQMDYDFSGVHVDVLPDPEAGQVLERYAEGKVSLTALSSTDRERLLRLGNGLPLGLMVLGRFLDHGLVKGGRCRACCASWTAPRRWSSRASSARGSARSAGATRFTRS